MNHGRFFIGALCLTGLLVRPASAEFQRVFENPGDGQEVSDIGVISGWVFSTTGNPVTVQLFIDGAPGETIPCCGSRLDVVANVPGAPLTTGFGLLANHKNLTSGPHTVAIQFTAMGESPVTDTHTVTVVKPGGQAGEAAETFSFLSDLDVTNATVALDSTAGEIIVTPVAAHDQGAPAGSGQVRQATLRLAWLNGRQDFNIVASSSGSEFAAAEAILAANCGVSGCHDGGGTILPRSMDLRAGQAFRSIVAIKSTENGTLFRVNPGDDDASYLYQKIIANPTVDRGSRMPLGGPFLSDDQINAIETWINAGAPPPQ
jgi:mono/diheme cytochrome c family protein